LSAIDLPVRTSFAFIPRANLLEQTRKNATRSRGLGSIFTWILNTVEVAHMRPAFRKPIAREQPDRVSAPGHQMHDEVIPAIRELSPFGYI
jgi:hypothetical protein